METIQDSTNPIIKTDQDTKPVDKQELTIVQQSYIDYKAVNGLITTDDGMRHMSVSELAGMLGVTRDAIYKARDATPDFWERVANRRKELGNQERMAKVHEIWYLRAIGSGAAAYSYMQLWLANFDPNFRMPTEKHELDVGGGLADLLQAMRKRKQAEEPKVIDADTSGDATKNNT